jgi:hypothetical protein
MHLAGRDARYNLKKGEAGKTGKTGEAGVTCSKCGVNLAASFGPASVATYTY